MDHLMNNHVNLPMEIPTENQVDRRRACDSCRARKIKCSKVVPCENCLKRDRPCTFEYILSKQLPLPQPMNLITSSTGMKPIETINFIDPRSSDLRRSSYTGPITEMNTMSPASDLMRVNSSLDLFSLPGALEKSTVVYIGSDNTRSSTPFSKEDYTQSSSAVEAPTNLLGIRTGAKLLNGTSLSENSIEIPNYELEMINKLVHIEPKLDSVLNSVTGRPLAMVSVITAAALMRFFRDINPIFPLFDQEFFIRNLDLTNREFSTILKSITLLMYLFDQNPDEIKKSLQSACQDYIAAFGLISPTSPFFVATFVLHQTLVTFLN